LSLDFTYNPEFADYVAATGSEKALGLGLVDARNTRLEVAAGVARQAERILAKVKGEACYLTTSCGLEFLPRDRARAKLGLLQQICGHLKGAK